MKNFGQTFFCGILVSGLSFLFAGCDQGKLTMPSKSDSLDVPTVSVQSGTLSGVREGGLNVFKGVPYAAPPVGEARWKPPGEPLTWSGTRQATQYGASCPQPGVRYSTIYSFELEKFSEDCLKLNIWAPADATNAPVFFWIHGGANMRGSSQEPLYDGARLAQTGIIVVTVNYRLGILGFLAHPELSAESERGVSGNYALLDQVAALRWVRNNIREFGGDPDKVTIAGESAGGLSVLSLLAMPDARGLFSKAIAQSSYMISYPELKVSRFGQQAAEDTGQDLVEKLNASSIAELRKMDSAAISNAAADLGYFPIGTVDGVVLPGQLVEIFEQGKQAPVPVLAGFNSGEIRSLSILAPPPPETAEMYEASIRERYFDLTDEFLRLYPSSDMQESIYATTRDALYGWTAERLSRMQTAIGQPAYLYLFDHGYPAADAAGLHGFHASELPFMFGNADRTPPLWPKIPETPTHTELSVAMVGYWSSFVRDGVPLANGSPKWPAFGKNRSFMHFTEAPDPSVGLFPGMYELHEEAVSRRRASGVAPWNWNTGIVSPKLMPSIETLTSSENQ